MSERPIRIVRTDDDRVELRIPYTEGQRFTVPLTRDEAKAIGRGLIEAATAERRVPPKGLDS